MPAEDAPWGHAGIPTVREYTRAYPVTAGFVAFAGIIGDWLLFQNTRNDIWPILAIPLIPLAYWILALGFIHGWLKGTD